MLSTTACDGPVGPDADCFERDVTEEFENPFIRYSCEVERPCEGLQLRCPGSDEAVDCGPDEAIVQDSGPLMCILDALAEGEHGHYSWSTTADADPGWASRGRNLWARGGKGYFASDHTIDLGTEIDGVRYVKLRSRSEFAACRDATTDPERLRCLMDPFTKVIGVVIEPG